MDVASIQFCMLIASLCKLYSIMLIVLNMQGTSVVSLHLLYHVGLCCE